MRGFLAPAGERHAQRISNGKRPGHVPVCSTSPVFFAKLPGSTCVACSHQIANFGNRTFSSSSTQAPVRKGHLIAPSTGILRGLSGVGEIHVRRRIAPRHAFTLQPTPSQRRPCIEILRSCATACIHSHRGIRIRESSALPGAVAPVLPDPLLTLPPSWFPS